MSALENAFEDMRGSFSKNLSLHTLDGFDSELVALCDEGSIHLYQSYEGDCVVNNMLLMEDSFPQLIKLMQERLDDNRNS